MSTCFSALYRIRYESRTREKLSVDGSANGQAQVDRCGGIDPSELVGLTYP